MPERKLTTAERTQVRKLLRDGFAPRTIASQLNIPLGLIQGLQNSSTNTAIQDSYAEERKEIAAIQEKHRQLRKNQGLQPTQFSNNQCALALTKTYDNAALGIYPSVPVVLGEAGVPEKDRAAVARKANKELLEYAWDSTADHPEAIAMSSLGYRGRTNKADACSTSVSHLIKSIQSSHKNVVSLLQLQAELDELKARLAIVEDNVTINPATKAEAMRIASKMKAQGSTQLEIANTVGKTERTIRRWWSEL